MSDKITFRGIVSMAGVLCEGKREYADLTIFTRDLDDLRHTSSIVGTEYEVTLTPIEPELKPCPFCGGEAALFDDRNGARRYQVRCLDCSTGRTLWASVKADAIAAWNRRTP